MVKMNGFFFFFWRSNIKTFIQKVKEDMEELRDNPTKALTFENVGEILDKRSGKL